MRQLCVPDWPWFNRHPVVWWDGRMPKSKDKPTSKDTGQGNKQKESKEKEARKKR